MTPESEAARLLEQMGEKKLPIDVLRIARRLKVRVERADLGEGCSGVLVRTGKTAQIGVQFHHHPNRQRFTIAHELGHYCLHEGGTYVDRSTTARFRKDESGSGTEIEEREANQFAAALLMPEKLVRAEFAKHPFDLGDDDHLRKLCRTFEVSAQAMMWRLTNLSLLD
ncbi:MAG: ImmA/IrrE family metallo-endopeptidase [Gemmatimonadales bacterium]|jgi:predicted transcriptional regulator